jgi:hypothetical protein
MKLVGSRHCSRKSTASIAGEFGNGRYGAFKTSQEAMRIAELATRANGRVILEDIRQCTRRGDSFGFETTLASQLSTSHSEMAAERLSGQPVFPCAAKC